MATSDTYLSAGSTQQAIAEVLAEAIDFAFRAGLAEQTRMDSLIFMQVPPRRLFGWGPNRVQPAGPQHEGWKMRAPHGSRISALALRADGQPVASGKMALLVRREDGEKYIVGGAVVVAQTNFTELGLRVDDVRAELAQLAERLRIRL